MALKKCPSCGYKINEERRQCPNCGNRNFGKEYHIEAGENKEEEYIIYENTIASKLYDWAKNLFVVSIIIGLIFLVVFFISLDSASNEYEKVSVYTNLYYAILFFCIAPIEKLLISAKAEQIELLYQIKKNTDKKNK